MPTRAAAAFPRCARSAAASERVTRSTRRAGGPSRGRARDVGRRDGGRGGAGRPGDGRAGHRRVPGDPRSGDPADRRHRDRRSARRAGRRPGRRQPPGDDLPGGRGAARRARRGRRPADRARAAARRVSRAMRRRARWRWPASRCWPRWIRRCASGSRSGSHPPRRRRRTPPARADRSVAAVGIAISAVRREFLGSRKDSAAGAAASISIGDSAERFVVGIDVEIDGGRTTVALGEASALLVSAGAFGGLRAAGARVAGSLSLGARVGLASLEGTPAGGAGATGGYRLAPVVGARDRRPRLAPDRPDRIRRRDRGGRRGARRARARRRIDRAGGRRGVAARRAGCTILTAGVSRFSGAAHPEGMTTNRIWLGLIAALSIAACSSKDPLLNGHGGGGSAATAAEPAAKPATRRRAHERCCRHRAPTASRRRPQS